MKSELEFGNEDDRLLRQLLNDSYESMGPSDEAMDRMFARISEFASASQPELTSETIRMPESAISSATAIHTPSQTVIPAYQSLEHGAPRRRVATVVPYENLKKRKSRISVPIIGSIAACLVVLAGIGALVTSNYRLPDSSDGALADMFATVDDIDSEAPGTTTAPPASQTAPANPTDPNAQAPTIDPNAQGAAVDPNAQPQTGDASGNQNQGQSAPAPSTSPEPSAPADTPEPAITPSASVTTDNGEQLVLARSDNDSVVEADSSLVSSEVSLGVVNDEANPGVTCIIYKYDGDEAEYAIQIEGSSGYYLADALPETGSIANGETGAPPVEGPEDQQLGQALDLEGSGDTDEVEIPEEMLEIE